MRTTLDIAEDVLVVAKSIAERERISVGQALSDLARQALTPRSRRRVRNGVPLLRVAAKASPVTMELVKELCDGEAEP